MECRDFALLYKSDVANIITDAESFGTQLLGEGLRTDKKKQPSRGCWVEKNRYQIGASWPTSKVTFTSRAFSFGVG